MNTYTISISRQFGSLGRPIAKRLSEILEIKYYDRDIVSMVAKRKNLSVRDVSDLEEKSNGFGFMRFPLGMGTNAVQDQIFKEQCEIIQEIAERESAIFVGRCADYILHNNENNINIFIYAPYEERLINCVNTLGMNAKEAKKMIAEVDKARDSYHMRYANYLPNDTEYMDFMINSAFLNLEDTALLLADLIKKKIEEK
jgi:cytidylate kinase